MTPSEIRTMDDQPPAQTPYVLSCGCRSQWGGFPSEWDSETRDCQPATSYGVLCERHYREYDARPAQYVAPPSACGAAASMQTAASPGGGKADEPAAQ